MKEWKKKLLAFIIGCLLALVLSELILSIYNPFPAVVKGDKVVLRANYSIQFENHINPKLPSKIKVTGNSLGFRGAELPVNHAFKVLTIGGSTTRCMYSPDSLTWSFLLGKSLQQHIPDLWLNNAGVTGHSTFGHTLLLKDYVLKLNPDVVLFLVGINDVERSLEDRFIIQDNTERQSLAGRIKKVLYQSETVALILNIYRSYKAKKISLSNGFDFDLASQPLLDVSSEKQSQKLAAQTPYLSAYEGRLTELVQNCIENNVQPILVTQPALFGDAIDVTTGIDLSRLQYNEMNGALMWGVLEKYNEVTRKVAKENGVVCVDLANQLPKDSKYYWDFIHYTPEGNRKIAELLADPVYKAINSAVK